MLVLSRRPQQSFVIGHDIVITVLEVNGDTVRLGIAAPRDVDIHREEVYRELQQANTTAASPSSDAVAAFTRRASAVPKPGQERPQAGRPAGPADTAPDRTRGTAPDGSRAGLQGFCAAAHLRARGPAPDVQRHAVLADQAGRQAAARPAARRPRDRAPQPRSTTCWPRRRCRPRR